jgi:peptidoglycan/LPS O-acetylase OafA/YrhL
VLAGIPDIATWLRHLTFTQTYGPLSFYFLPGVGVAWTLTVEVVFYALLPLVALSLLRGQWRPVRTVVVLLAVGLAMSIGWLSQITPGKLNPFVHHLWFPSYAMCFAVGMAMAIISVALRTGTAPRWWAVFDHVGAAGWLCWGIALEFFGFCVYFGGPVSGALPTPSDLIVRELLYLGFSMFLLCPLVFGGAHTLKTLLSHPVLRWVGTVSYGLFLWHLTVLELILRSPLQLSSAGTFVLTLAGALVLAAISWYFVERPAQQLGDRLLARSRRRPVPASARTGSPPVRSLQEGEAG